MTSTATATTATAAPPPPTEPAALMFAAERGAIRSIQEWCTRGGDINAPIGVDLGSPLGPAATPLQWAAFHGNVTAVRTLLECGARDFRAPHAAARQGHSAVLEALIEWGTDPNAADEFGQTPLHYAAAFGHVPCIRQLLRCGANAALREVSGRTPADLAASAGYPDAASLLGQCQQQQQQQSPTEHPASPCHGKPLAAILPYGGGYTPSTPASTRPLPYQHRTQQQHFAATAGGGPDFAAPPPGFAYPASAWAWKHAAPLQQQQPGGDGPGAGAAHGSGGGYTDTGVAHAALMPGYYGAGSDGWRHQQLMQPLFGAGTAPPTFAVTAPATAPATAPSAAAPIAGPGALVQLADSRTRLRDWLTSLSMLYALPALVTHGYDDIDFIAAVGLSEADVDNLGVTAPGHRRKLLHLYGIDRFAAPPRPPAAALAPPAALATPEAASAAPAAPPAPATARAVSPVSAPDASKASSSDDEEEEEEEEEGGDSGEEEEEEDVEEEEEEDVEEEEEGR